MSLFSYRPYFKDRIDAGRRLAQALIEYEGDPDIIVLGLPRGGVPVAYEVAKALAAPLDVWLVRKIGAPGHEELALGALAMGGVQYINHEMVLALGVADHLLHDVIARERTELKRRNTLYRQDRPLPDLKGKTVILVDDGVATGATMQAAVQALQQTDVREVIVAIPAGPVDSCRRLERMADRVICLHSPSLFYGVGQAYYDFPQISDDEVLMYLRHGASGRERGPRSMIH